MEELLKEFCNFSDIKDCNALIKKFLESKNKYTITVFTDGACSCNGKMHAKAGIGLYFENTKETYSENVKNILDEFFPTLKVTKFTNNIAELLAIFKALYMILDNVKKNNYKVIIKTDSRYCINIFTKWYKSWQKSNWKTAGGKPVLNKEIIIYILKLINQIPDIVFTYVPAHTEIPPKNEKKYLDWYGNYKADKMAVEGAKNI